MAADPTLVKMAYAAAAAKAPGDWSGIFEKQYEGLIASHKALAGAMEKGVQAIGEVKIASIKRQKTDKAVAAFPPPDKAAT